MFPEMTYGHLKMVRSIIGEVLAEKVRSGYFDLDTAIDVARLVYFTITLPAFMGWSKIRNWGTKSRKDIK